jgi:hypothetical protein
MYTFKGTVSSLTIEGDVRKISFAYSERVSLNGEGCYGIAYDEDGSSQLMSLKENETFVTDYAGVFDFLSLHSREMLEISFDDENNVKVIKKVTLRYE